MSLQNSPTIIAGQILSSSWGYDQTNIDFYKVVAVKNGWAWLQKMESISQSEPSGFGMSTLEMPGVVIEKEKPFRRKIKGAWIMINSYAGASPWKGQPMTATHYA